MDIKETNKSHLSGRVEKVVGAKEFLKIISSQRDRISSSEVLLPKLGSNGLGKFKVVYK